jgi:hypothetical protein
MTDEARTLVLAISERCPVRTGGTCYCKHRKAMVRVQSALDAARLAGAREECRCSCNPLCGCMCHARESHASAKDCREEWTHGYECGMHVGMEK